MSGGKKSFNYAAGKIISASEYTEAHYKFEDVPNIFARASIFVSGVLGGYRAAKEIQREDHKKVRALRDEGLTFMQAVHSVAADKRAAETDGAFFAMEQSVKDGTCGRFYEPRTQEIYYNEHALKALEQLGHDRAVAGNTSKRFKAAAAKRLAERMAAIDSLPDHRDKLEQGHLKVCYIGVYAPRF